MLFLILRNFKLSIQVFNSLIQLAKFSHSGLNNSHHLHRHQFSTSWNHNSSTFDLYDFNDTAISLYPLQFSNIIPFFLLKFLFSKWATTLIRLIQLWENFIAYINCHPCFLRKIILLTFSQYCSLVQ